MGSRECVNQTTLFSFSHRHTCSAHMFANLGSRAQSGCKATGALSWFHSQASFPSLSSWNSSSASHPVVSEVTVFRSSLVKVSLTVEINKHLSICCGFERDLCSLRLHSGETLFSEGRCRVSSGMFPYPFQTVTLFCLPSHSHSKLFIRDAGTLERGSANLHTRLWSRTNKPQKCLNSPSPQLFRKEMISTFISQKVLRMVFFMVNTRSYSKQHLQMAITARVWRGLASLTEVILRSAKFNTSASSISASAKLLKLAVSLSSPGQGFLFSFGYFSCFLVHLRPRRGPFTLCDLAPSLLKTLTSTRWNSAIAVAKETLNGGLTLLLFTDCPESLLARRCARMSSLGGSEAVFQQ